MREISLALTNGRVLGIDEQVTCWRKTCPTQDGVHLATGFFHVPKTLIDGSLPTPEPWGEHAGWIAECDWDFLIYAYSNGRRAKSYAGELAAKRWCGIGSFDYSKLGSDTVNEMRSGLWERLCAAGLARHTDRVLHGRPEYQLLIPPAAAPSCRLPSLVPATMKDLEAEYEPYVLIPNVLMTEKVWKQVRLHELRRLLAAIYCFNHLSIHGGVDPARLRLQDGRILVSDEFLKATGSGDPLRLGHGLDFLVTECGLAFWQPVELSVATLRPGERRMVYASDASGADAPFVLRPTLQPAFESKAERRAA